ncbi:MAG TPA: hypothetical protein VMW86_10340 [Dehalococcoidales bacterium]|nr:hypothetical protein [Dehalococcoidales bacterium]
MTEKRTEEDKLLQAPLVMTFGGKSFNVAPLVIKESRAWRREVIDLLKELPKFAGATTDDADLFQSALNGLLVNMPDKVIDLVFSYCKSLDRDEIESMATDAEVAAAFDKIVAVAFPLVSSIGKVMGNLSP